MCETFHLARPFNRYEAKWEEREGIKHQEDRENHRREKHKDSRELGPQRKEPFEIKQETNANLKDRKNVTAEQTYGIHYSAIHITYKQFMICYWKGFGSRDWDHKLFRKLFFQSKSIKKKSSFQNVLSFHLNIHYQQNKKRKILVPFSKIACFIVTIQKMSSLQCAEKQLVLLLLWYGIFSTAVTSLSIFNSTGLYWLF